MLKPHDSTSWLSEAEGRSISDVAVVRKEKRLVVERIAASLERNSSAKALTVLLIYSQGILDHCTSQPFVTQKRQA